MPRKSKPPAAAAPVTAPPSRPRSRRKFIWMMTLGIAIPLVAALLYTTRSGPRFKPDKPVNLLFITLDTTRADGLGCFGNAAAQTPNLDRLADNGIRFTKACTVAPLTLPSHASLMTGTYPPHLGIHYNGTHALSESATTLAEVLTQAGYTCGAAVGAYVLHSQFGLAQGFKEYADRFNVLSGGEVERRAEFVTDDGLRFIDTNKDRPFFFWAHYYDPHEPYAPPPPYDQLFAADPYAGEIAYMDSQIGRLINGLDRAGILNQTLIVAVADHGESLMQADGRQGHGMFVYEETMHIPMIMSNAGLMPAGRVVENEVSIVDVMPTVLSLLHLTDRVALPRVQQGLDLSGLITHDKALEQRAIYIETFGPREVFGWSELQGILQSGWKYIRAPRPELYDLAVDPREKNNLWAAQPERGEAMSARFDQMLASISSESLTASVAGGADKAKLESLGYISSDAEPDDASSRPDPKDMIGLAVAINRAAELQTKNPGAAVEAFKAILADHPDASAAHAAFGKLLMGMGQLDAATAHFTRVLQLRPDAVQTRRLLAFTLFQLGRLDEALAAVDASLAIHPASNQSLFIKSLILDAMNRTDQAVQCVYESLQVDGQYDPARLHYGRLLNKSARPDDALTVLSAIGPASSARYAARQDMLSIFQKLGRKDDVNAMQTELAQLAAQGAPRTPAIIIAGGGY